MLISVVDVLTCNMKNPSIFNYSTQDAYLLDYSHMLTSSQFSANFVGQKEPNLLHQTI